MLILIGSGLKSDTFPFNTIYLTYTLKTFYIYLFYFGGSVPHNGRKEETPENCSLTFTQGTLFCFDIGKHMFLKGV